ncbi:MAG: hydroxymethylglutaryl-CoA lyase [Cyclobacteriaceae bacterium]|nr:hydroxymethylglutaryl-CoA lyase [Cyclobacteriaceae bacterium]
MKIIECPRDAMQGIEKFIPTEVKVNYLNELAKVGFDTIDFGSFVSPKAIPQMRDTAEVVGRLDLSTTKSKLLAIVANTRGAEDAAQFEEITYLGFPLSISETFQQRNTNKSITEALNTLSEIQELCHKKGKTLVTYISMGFGNPYGDPYDMSIVSGFVDILSTLNVQIVSLADTIGVSTPDQITRIFKEVSSKFPGIEFGAHLHSNPATANEKIEAAFNAGCKRFDGALKGWGGCPMAKDDLVGNLATERILDYLASRNAKPVMDEVALAKAMQMADTFFEG